MLHFEQLVVYLNGEIEKEKVNAVSTRFERSGDHDYIVGRVSMAEDVLRFISEVQKRMEMEDVEF